MKTREQLLRTKCWGCWWKENGRCYQEKLGPMGKTTRTDLDAEPSLLFVGGAKGHEITDSHIAWCNEAEVLGWEPRSSKREVLERFFDQDKLIILSELATRDLTNSAE